MRSAPFVWPGLWQALIVGSLLATSACRAEPAPVLATFGAIEAPVLYSAFEANEVHANQQYKGQRLQVRGTIHRIATDITGTPFVALKTASPVASVQAMFPKASASALAPLASGQVVTVECLCEGKLGNVMLRDCRLVKE